MGRLRIVTLGLSVLLATGAAVAAPVPDLYQNKTVSRTFTQEITGLEVSTPAGSLSVRPGKKTTVVAKERWLVQEPDVTMSVVDKVLKIDVSCPPLNSGPIQINMGCSVGFAITVPVETTVQADVNAGSIDVASLIGNENLYTNSGSVKVESVTADSLTAGTNSGSVDLAKLDVDKIDASANSGSISIDDATVPTSVKAVGNSGSIDVAVPAGVYNITVETNSGSRSVHGLTNSDSATRTIEATTNSGSVSVHAR